MAVLVITSAVALSFLGCVIFNGRPEGNSGSSSRWGDLVVTFNTAGVMLAYVYGPGAGANSAATFNGVKLGDTMAGLLAADPPAVFTGRQEAGWWRWRMTGDTPAEQGYADGATADSRVTTFWQGLTAACFGVSR